MFGLSPISLIIYGVVAVALAIGAYKVVTGVEDWIGEPYAVKQRDKDLGEINKAKAAQQAAEGQQRAAESERDHAKEDTNACVEKIKVQSNAIDVLRGQAKNNAAAAAAAKEEAKKAAAAIRPQLDDLQKKAAAAPKLLACEEELAISKSAMRQELERRRGISGGAKK